MLLVSTEEFQGLKLTKHVNLDSCVAAIVGRNGAGKTRLLHAIAEGKIVVEFKDAAITRDRIWHLKMDQFQPNLTFGFDRVRHREGVLRAVQLYATHRDLFHVDPQESLKAIAQAGGSADAARGSVDIHALAAVVSHASSALGKQANALEPQDIEDYFTYVPVMGLASLNVTATMLAYWDRVEQNDLNEFRLAKYGHGRPIWSPTEFEKRFGPPPWYVFNDFLRSVLDGRYHIKIPTVENISTYEAKLFRDDGREISPAWLSSGEKVLMWLCLIMYATNTKRMSRPPALLLLDEPDAALHPQMVQKLHMALKDIVSRFDSNVIFTTYSPTTVALFEGGPIFQVSEHDLVRVDQDAAIGELLVGVDQVSIHYTNRKQVYVESHVDAELYRTLFGLLRKWGKTKSAYISLSFIPAAPKLSPALIKQLLAASFGEQSVEQVEAFVLALNGQGNCAQVAGAVESLSGEGSETVHGVVDWDLVNKPQQHLYVLGAGLFYSIENAILNPLTLGLYLLHNYPGKLPAKEYGLADGFDPLLMYTDVGVWQPIADGVTRHVLQVDMLAYDVECAFLNGEKVWFDQRYVHMNGHALERLLKETSRYPFLNEFTKRPTLAMDVSQRGIQFSHGRTLPMAFVDLFNTIQTSR